MSLIADALKAAQGERSKPDPAESTTRRAVAASVLQSGGGGGGAFAGVPVGISPPLKWALIALGGALIAAAAVIYLAPDPSTSPVSTSQEGAPLPGSGAPRSASELPFLGALTPEIPQTAPPPPQSAELDALMQRGGTLGVVSGGGSSSGRASQTGGEVAGGPVMEGDVAERPSVPSPPSAAAAPRVGPPPRPIDAPAAQPIQTMGGRFELAVEPAGFSADDLMAQAASAHRSGDYSTAIQLYGQVLGQNPNHVQALNNLGISYQAMGDFPRARDTYQRVISLDQRNAAAWSNLGAVFGRMGDVAEAMRALGEAVSLDPSNSAAKVNLANHHLARRFYADARLLLEDVVRAEPGHPEAHYNLGRIFDEQGDRASAVKHYQAFLQNSRGRFPAYEVTVRQRIALLGG